MQGAAIWSKMMDSFIIEIWKRLITIPHWPVLMSAVLNQLKFLATNLGTNFLHFI